MATTLRDIGFRLGYDLDRQSEAAVENSIKSLKGMASKMLGGIAIGVAIKKTAQFVADCVSMASEVEEMENKFNVVFGELSDDVDAWAQNFADAVGRNKNDIKTYLADQQNLMVGFGMTREAGAELSEQITSLALDLASFGNIDETAAVNAMTKAIMGESESAKTLGAVLNDATRAEAMYAMGLTGSYNSLDQLTKMQVNYQAILMQSADAVGDCERSLGSYQSTLRQFQSKLKEVKQLIGQFFMPTFQKVLSYGVRMITSLRNIIQRLSDFVDKVGGSEKVLRMLGIALALTFAAMNINNILKMAQNFMVLAKAIVATGAKALAVFAVILTLVLIVEDFIAFMRGEDSLIGSLLDKAGINSEEVRDRIIAAWTAVKSSLLSIWGAIKNAAASVWDGLRSFWEKHGEQIKTAFSNIWRGISSILTSTWNAIKALAMAVFGALLSFWTTWGETIKSFFFGVWEVIKAVFRAALDVIVDVFSVFAALFAGDWQTLWQEIANLFSDIWNAIKAIFMAILDTIVGVFNNFVSVFIGAWNALWSSAKELFSSFCNAIVSIFNQICTTITTIMTNIWNTVSEKVAGIKNTIVEGFNAAIAFITSLPARAVQWGADIIQGIIDGIQSRISSLTATMSNVASSVKSFIGFSEPEKGPLSNFHTYMPDMIDLMTKGIEAGRPRVKEAFGNLAGDMSIMAKASLVTGGTAAMVPSNNTVSKSVIQNNHFTNTFNGDRAGQRKSADAMNSASGDAVSEMARALAFAR